MQAMRSVTHSLAASLLAALLLALVAGPASAIPLGTLIGGGSLASADGAISFSGFSVSFADSLGESPNALAGIDLMAVDVQVLTLADQRILAFEGGIEMPAGNLGRMWISHSADAGAGFEIIGAALSLKAETLGMFSTAIVTESIGGDASASLVASSRFDGTGSTSDGTAFAVPGQHLDVRSDIQLDGGWSGTTRVVSLQQAFSVANSSNPVPEPGSALLFAVGVVLTATRLRRPRA